MLRRVKKCGVNPKTGFPYGHSRLTKTVAEADAGLAMEALGWNPFHTALYCNDKKWWACRACGHVWECRVAGRARGAGCPRCAGPRQGGFDRQRPAWVYLVARGVGDQQLLKIGVSNQPETRLRTLRSQGWARVDLSEVMPGEEAWSLEQAFLAALRRQGVATGEAVVGDRLSGCSEMWRAADFRVRTLGEVRGAAGAVVAQTQYRSAGLCAADR